MEPTKYRAPEGRRAPRAAIGAQRPETKESHDMQRFRAERTQSAEPESLDGANESRALEGRRAPRTVRR